MATKSHTTAYAESTSALDPRCLYPLSAFIRTSGISKSRLREARLMGHPLPTINVGKRVFVRGSDAIAFVEKLAELSAPTAGR